MNARLMAPREVKTAMAQLPRWGLRDSVIETSRSFPSFAEALAFVAHVGEVAEALNHHPDIDVRYRTVRLAVSTHSVGGLTELDFELARRVEALTP